jgi:hypothetical protein
VVTLRLPAFRFLQFFVARMSEAKSGSGIEAAQSFPDVASLIRATKPGTEERKPGPTPVLSLDRTGFALDVTTFLQARDPFAIARMGCCCAATLT